MINIYSGSEKMQKKGIDIFRSYITGGLNFSIAGSNASIKSYQNSGEITQDGLEWKGVSSAGGFMGSNDYLLTLYLFPITLSFSFACDYSLSGNYYNAYRPFSNGPMPFLFMDATSSVPGETLFVKQETVPFQSGTIKVISDNSYARLYLNNSQFLMLDLQHAQNLRIGILGLNGGFEYNPVYDMTAYLKNVKYVSGVAHALLDDWFLPHATEDMIRGPKFLPLEGRKIYAGGQFRTIKATDRIFKDGTWRYVNHTVTGGTLRVIYSTVGELSAYPTNVLEYKIDEETAWRTGSFAAAAEIILPVGIHKIVFHTTLGLSGNLGGQFSVGEHTEPITTMFDNAANKELTFEITSGGLVGVYANIMSYN